MSDLTCAKHLDQYGFVESIEVLEAPDETSISIALLINSRVGIDLDGEMLVLGTKGMAQATYRIVEYSPKPAPCLRLVKAVTLEACVCGEHFECPDGWHWGDALPCSCTPDCALEGDE